ncbi:MAG: YggS family pyridoxal phosphate-dependent enzyme [Spirochaetaceae bacterium]|nr:YggS family pyridoxal phosphate-dependent enzyme [Spirochaetaceae bacterium]
MNALPPKACTSIARRIAQITESINECCLRSGRKSEEIKLMAVSKFFPREDVEAALQAGITLFGESRVQEAETKFAGWRTGAHEGELHLIGGLQRNKAKRALAIFDCIQSVDRTSLIDTLGELTTGREKPLMILLELNCGEVQKGGYRHEDELFGAAERVFRYPALELRGLMTVAPFTEDVACVRQSFRRLFQAREKLWQAFPGTKLSTLSMGMSGDYPIAIEEGATLIRIGTAIFGERQ